MRKSILLNMAVVLPCLLAAEIKAEDKTALEGMWIIRSASRGGEPFREPVGDKAEFAPNTLTIHSKNDTKTTANIKIDTATSPKQLDISLEDKTVRGIYEVMDNSLRMCLAKVGEPRPTTLASQPDSENVLLTLERVKESDE